MVAVTTQTPRRCGFKQSCVQDLRLRDNFTMMTGMYRVKLYRGLLVPVADYLSGIPVYLATVDEN